MKKLYRQIAAFFALLFSNSLSFIIFLQLLSPFNRMLKSGLMEGSGTVQFIKVLAGGLLLMLSGIGWLGFFIFSFRYYFKVADIRTLLIRLLLLSGLEFFFFPVIVFVNHMVFPSSVILIEWLTVIAGIYLGILSLFGHFRLKNEV